MDEFVVWINGELNRRGWSRSEAARRGNISPSSIDKVVGGFSRPGLKVCRGLARAFEMPEEEVFRRAGLLRSRPAPRVNARRPTYRIAGREPDVERLIEQFERLSPADQERISDLVERLLEVLEPRIVGETGPEE